MDEGKKYLKWIFTAAVAAGIGIYPVPFLIKITLDVITLGILGVVAVSFWMLLPAIGEFLAQLSYIAWSSAIKADPGPTSRGLV